jgi:hypothetical protein
VGLIHSGTAGQGGFWRGKAGPGNARQGFHYSLIHCVAAWHVGAGPGKSRYRKARFSLTVYGEKEMRFEKSADTKVLENVLSEMKVGDVLTYEELSRSIGRDVRQFALGALTTARQSLMKEKRMVFDIERNVGIKRLDDNQIIDSTESDRLKMQRTGKKALTKLASVEFSNLTPDKKKQHVVASAQIGAIVMFSKKSSQSKIESHVKSDSSTLAIGETLKMFT